MVTIKDIAKIANVSTGTVDRVIHNRQGVSEKTKERINKILKENNFKINVIARSLALRKKYSIAVLMPGFNNDNLFWKSPYLGISKARDEMNHLGVQIEYFQFSQLDEVSYKKQCDIIVELNPDAVIFSPYFQKETLEFTKRLEGKSIPYLFINLDLDGYKNICFIGQDAYKSGYLAAKLMHLCTGNKTDFLIPLVESKLQNNSVLENRIKGFKDYFDLKQLSINYKTLYFEGLRDENLIKLELNAILKKNPHISGVLVPSSRISIISRGISKAYKNKLTLIGFDTTTQNIECLKNDEVTFLISQKSFNQGYQSVKVITDYLIQNIQPSKKIFSPIEIITKENVEFSQRNKWEYKKINS